MPLKCFLDLDGVLVDFMKGAHDFHNIPYDYDNMYPYKLGHWDCIPPANGRMTTSQFWDGLNEDFWANMPWMEDGKEILSIVEERFDKENICILTSPALNPGCAAGKLRWIQREMPDYARRFLIGPSKEFCAGKWKILIDDRDLNVKKFSDNDGVAILIPRKWNRLHESEGKISLETQIAGMDKCMEILYGKD